MYNLLDQPDRLDIREEDLEAFFGWNADYFLGQWELWLAGRPPTWNPAGFLLGVCWLVYRQMWLAAGLALLLFWGSGLLQAGLEGWLLPDPLTSYAAVFRLAVLHVLIGQFGNRLYLDLARREVARVKRQYPAGETREEIRRRGGTSRLAVLIFLLLLLSVAFCQIWGVPVGGTGRAFS